jgi:hypothetical protein
MRASLSLCVLPGSVYLTAVNGQVIVTGGSDAAPTTELSTIPNFGIFWSESGRLPPSPFDPLPQLPLYQVGPADESQYVPPIDVNGLDKVLSIPDSDFETYDDLQRSNFIARYGKLGTK